MSKVDYTRDYYADLELSGRTDDIDLIKKQYRKLSLKKHPDRPGGSNEQFNIISQAHVVLIDAELKAKYDNHRSRTTRASGIRGNPWQDAGKEWAPPPRHPGFAQRATSSTQKRQSATSSADRYEQFTASAARRPAGKKAAESAHTWQHWQAWEDMRSGSKNKAGAQNASGSASARASGTSRTASYTAPPPPPVPPRPSPQKQPKGAFGSRVQRGGYVPESPGDEPSVTSNNYFTTRTHTNLFNETSSAARARRRVPSDAKHDSTFTDMRQSTPYQTHGGEKFDPWNGASNIGRSRSTREPNRRSDDDEEEEASANANTRQRSASVPDDSDNSPQASHGGNGGLNDRQTAGSTTASGEYQPHQEGFSNGGTANGKNSPKLYANQSHFNSRSLNHEAPHQAQQAKGRAGDEIFYKQEAMNLSPELQELLGQQLSKKQSSSGDKPSPQYGLNAFERKLHQVITELSAAKYRTSLQSGAVQPEIGSDQMNTANNVNTNSFGTKFADDTFKNDSHRFTRNSTDNINTRFVAEEDETNWQFNAGSPVDETGRPAMPRSKSGSRIGRKSPFNSQTSQTPFVGPANGATSAQNSSFNPDEWSEKIGPQIFEAQAAQKTSVPTSRSIRNPGKKNKPVRMTAGTAGMVESDESSSGQDDIPRGQPAPGHGHSIDGAASPNAMDVDPPSATQAQARNTVRNIPVTPSRPEWRAGDVGLGIMGDPKPAAEQESGFNPPAGGSEDSEEFRASFADLRNVEPFAERATGLESFGDLKANLPFPSVASGHVPTRKPVPKTHNIALPEPPRPPQIPPALGVPILKASAVLYWKKYAEDFARYMGDWHVYNARFIDHFAARKVQLHEKMSNIAWLESRDGAGVQEYMTWAEEDREVRTKWTEACNAHEKSVQMFCVCREKMLK